MIDLTRKQIAILFIVALILVMLFYKYTRKPIANEEIQQFNNLNTKPKIINFNTSWCYWSKKVQPVWDKLTEAMKGKDIEVLDVKCDIEKNQELCERYQVEGFPSIKLVVGNSILDYEGDRSIDDIKKFISTNVKY